MRFPNAILLAFSFFCAVILIYSCKNDPCQKTICYNQGGCIEGKCSCLDGFEGDSCEKQWSDKFLTSLTVGRPAVDVVKGAYPGTFSHPVYVRRFNEMSVGVVNLRAYRNSVTFNIPSSNLLTTTDFKDAGNRKFTGTGGLNSAGDIVFNYIITYPDNKVDTCVCTVDMP